jgi:glycosyltransferase involved in cell wall biosynthesis
MFCSTIIPTVGRPTLTRAVESILNQTLDAKSFEVIVVNDSDQPLAAAPWQTDERVQLINTQQRERSVARNTGAAAANGRFLHFLDDDDWLAPGALSHLYRLAQERPSAWLYGSTQLVDGNGRFLIRLHHQLNGNCFLPAMAGEWIPLQASLIDARVFFELGGFNSLLSGPEDVDLLRRVTLRHDIAGTETLVACVEWRTAGSTTDYDHHPRQSRWAREQILDEPGVFGRLHQSTCLQTDDKAAWYGRIPRLYLTSTVWNGRQRRFLSAASRTLYGLAAAAQAGPHLLSRSFWRSFSRAYASETFARGQTTAQHETSAQP